MKLDGYDVEPGDYVYDLFFGDGMVKNLTADGRAVVAFGPRTFTYNEAGVGQHGRRSLYWHNPILLVPMKDEAAWDMQRNLNQAIAQCLRPGVN
ncbi:hypothetical protein G3O06_07685 [Burkholderia sp. Ac-20345]|uniref:hypothetical protein n=1 Tax=Burkholderia sp. Ac-20345 TaxID=2703891 RepID=UPI00197B75B7|nr:hypothetical protein [Burkholderia sp. Ac-20345]MBN3777431.1 hypothetical protein [Burkholderia sp. Ac-20345]